VHPLVRALLENAQEPTWIVGAEGNLLLANGAFAQWLDALRLRVPAAGDSIEHLLQEPWPEVLHRTLSGRSVAMDAAFPMRDGLRSFSIVGTPVEENGELSHAVFAARIVTPLLRDAREDLFELSLTRLFIADERPLAIVLRAAVEYLCEANQWDCGVVWLLGENNSSALDPVAIYASSALPNAEDFADKLKGVRFGPGQGLPGRAWSRDDILWIGDIAEDSNVIRAYLAHRLGLHGAVAVPLRDGGRVIGVLELLTREVRPNDALHARSLTQAGAGLGRLIQRRRAEEERKHLLHVIERKGQEWTLTFDAIELPIFITGMDAQVRRMNRAARDLTERDYSDVIGRRLKAISAQEPWATLAACVEAVRDSGEICTAQAHDATQDRSWEIAANSYHPVDEPPRVILIIRETTGMVRLQNAVRRGEQLSALGELVAGVAHEVRNPIFGMQITLDALESSVPADPDTVDLLGALRRWLDRLNRLMESLLAYGRNWSVDLKPGLLAEVLDQALEGTRDVARHAGTEVRATIEPSRPVLMDATRLAHAFENLIINAIQHTDESRPLVELSAREEDGFVECTIRDHGAGFAPEDLPRVFEPFYTRRRGGTGLGLAIVQRIIDEHGGTVHAGNADGDGALMSVRLPVYQGNV
jgi:signal transduction histidine kinase